MNPLTAVKMPQIRSSKRRSLSITPKLGQELGITPDTTFNVVKQDGKVVLEPAEDALRAEILADVAKSQQDFQEGRCSPAFDNMDDAIAWLNSDEE